MKIISEIENIRLDKFLSLKLENQSRDDINFFIKNKEIDVNGKFEKPSYKIKKFDEININDAIFHKYDINPEKMELKIVYENDDYALIDKDINTIVHPAGKIVSGTLVNGLLYKYKNLSDISGKDRPGIIHRLDKDTTGLMIIAKNNETHLYFKDLFKKHEILKEYIAIVHGNFDNTQGKIDIGISRDNIHRKKMIADKNGKEAISFYEVLDQTKDFSLVKIKIKTGRTHQIRVHMGYINHPLLCDPLYSNRKEKYKVNHPFLHCMNLGFVDKNKNIKYFHANIHKEFKEMIDLIKLKL
ncbi:MAG: RluA family pseudouridine synthase [Peptoniphilaceae bacterium]|nr:RluA family pseudouridine synthase [Peptoniphilaceae bacterium]MDD7383417.1 RluA family pseudouridine synthase [Peptoniphilaceae bacterium]MDY3738812.1 RluA family pseudouridine synthase [Peptoniphilaceae bacterium]